VLPRIFLNLAKSLSRKFPVKYHGFKNLCKILWVSRTPLNTMDLKTFVKYHGIKNFRKIP